MRDILKMVGGLLVIALLIAHFFLLALFVAPVNKLLGLIIKSSEGFVVAEELPEDVEKFLVIYGVPVVGDYKLDTTSKGKLVLGILQFRREHFMETPEQIALDTNLLNYGEGIIGIKAASQYYYKKPLSEVSEKEWINLVNLHNVSSKK